MAVKHPHPVKKQAPKKESRQSVDWINKLTEKQSFGLLGSLIGILILFLFFDFITGSKLYLFKDIGSDTINTFYPSLIYIAKYLRIEGFPAWSFSQGMGQNIMSGSIGNPFDLILYLLGPSNLAYGIVFMEILKIFLGGMFFYMYLKILNLSRLATIVGALLYAFSGFMILGGSWYVFSTEAVYLALLLLSFELLYSKNSWILFPVVIALFLILQPFDLFLYGLFLIIYMLFRFFGDENPRFGKFLILVLKLAGLAILGGLISSVFLFENIQLLLDSPRVSGNSTYFQKLMAKPVLSIAEQTHNVTAIMRMFSNDMLGNGSNFKAWYNYLEAPMFYIGLLPLLLFTQIFPLVDKRRKIIYAVFLAIFIIPVIFPFIRNAFWAFTGDYYRGFSLFLSLALLLMSLKAISEFDKVKKPNVLLLLGTFGFLMLLLYYPYTSLDRILRTDIRSIVTFFLIIYTILILLMSYVKDRMFIKILVVVFVCIEMIALNSFTIKDRSVISDREWKQKVGYNDYTVEAIAHLKQIDKGFYRINKDYNSGPAIHSSINDAKVQDYYGTMSYSSFNQKYYIRFLEETGVITKGVEDQSRWAPGLSTRPLLQLVGSIKYNLSNKPKSYYTQMGYDSIGQFGDVKILKNRFFLPLGFTYDKYIPLTQYQKLSRLQKDITLFNACVVEEPVREDIKKLKEFTIKDTIKLFTYPELTAEVNARKSDSLRITHFSDNHIKGNITVSEPKMLYLSIPHDKGWKILVDGKPVEAAICNIGFIGIYLDKGTHEVSLDFNLPNFGLSLILSCAGLLLLLVLVGFQYRFSKRGKESIE